MNHPISIDKPKSWITFLVGVALGFLVFSPIALVGLAYERIPVFLTGMAGAGICWIAAACMGFWFAKRLADGRYQDLHQAPWREQIW